jgi:hypothetical protein
VSAGLNHEHHDASNLSGAATIDVTGWTGFGYMRCAVTKQLQVTAYARYAPARALAQGRASSYTAFNVGALRKFGEKASLSLWWNDPLHLAKYSSAIGDDTYAQTSSSDNHMRSVSATFTWSWGKQPEQKERRQSGAGGAQGDAPGN